MVLTVMTSNKKLNELCTKPFNDNQFNFFQIIPDPHLFNIFFPLYARAVAKPQLLEKFPGWERCDHQLDCHGYVTQ